jgi:hypothetical protein
LCQIVGLDVLEQRLVKLEMPVSGAIASWAACGKQANRHRTGNLAALRLRANILATTMVPRGASVRITTASMAMLTRSRRAGS